MEGYTGNIAVVYMALAVCGYVAVWAWIEACKPDKTKQGKIVCCLLLVLALWCLYNVLASSRLGLREWHSYGNETIPAATVEDAVEMDKWFENK